VGEDYFFMDVFGSLCMVIGSACHFPK